MKNTSRSRESFSVFSAMCIVFLTWTTFSVFVFFSTAAIQPDLVAAHFFGQRWTDYPLLSTRWASDGVVVAGSLSFQGHFHSLTPGSLSTVQTFTQSLLVRIAMNSMPLYEEPADMTSMLVICQLNIQDQTWKSFDNIAVTSKTFSLNLFAKVSGNKKGSPDFFF